MGLQRLALFFIVYVLSGSLSQRRIRDGTPLGKLEKKYAVYFLKSNVSTSKYTDWLCGGALVAKLFIVTAAACLEDVTYLYAVAGVKTLLENKAIYDHKCTKWYKRKVVYTCVPRAYEFDYENVGKWSAIDIGIAKVESAFVFQDGYCDFHPVPIPINYEPKYQEPGIDAIVLGWGHKEIWKQPGDTTRLVQKDLHYAPVSIMNKNKCKEAYSDVPGLPEIIEKYMICTQDKGNLDVVGNLITTLKPDAEGCSKTQSGDCRRNFENKLNLQSQNTTVNAPTRRQGICQNDHGGPLVTWVGGKEYLIGVASVFRVNDESKCVGPYLYTSTQCNGAFLNCILNPSIKTRRGNSICDLPAKERGFDMIHKYISWVGHMDGPADNEKINYRPADNEKINYRPLIPLRSLHKRRKKLRFTEDV